MSERGVTESAAEQAALAGLESVDGCAQHGAENAPVEPDCERITREPAA